MQAYSQFGFGMLRILDSGSEIYFCTISIHTPFASSAGTKKLFP